MKAYPGKVREHKDEFYKNVFNSIQAKKMSGRTDYCPNIIFNQSQVYNRWVNYTLPGPEDFQLRDQGLLYHQGKRGHSLETEPINIGHHHQALSYILLCVNVNLTQLD